MIKLTVLFVLFFSVNLSAQVKIKKLKETISLQMPTPDDSDHLGTRGASVVWHPAEKKYYAAFAGNASYPLGIFDVSGKLLSNPNLSTRVDTRGLWYNPSTKSIWANTYNDNGWVKYLLDSKGIVKDVVTMFKGMNQPNDQAVAAYIPSGNKVLFLNGSAVKIYNGTIAKPEKEIVLHLGRTKKEGISEEEDATVIPEYYNSTAIIYTGIKTMEIGLLHKEDNQIELYDLQSGFLTRKLGLPDNTKTEYSFNFAYTNGIYWLFDIDNRTWVGYK